MAPLGQWRIWWINCSYCSAHSSFANLLLYSCRKYLYSTTKGIEFFIGWRGICKTKKCKEMYGMKLNWNFQRGVGSNKKSLIWGGINIILNYILWNICINCDFFSAHASCNLANPISVPTLHLPLIEVLLPRPLHSGSHLVLLHFINIS